MHLSNGGNIRDLDTPSHFTRRYGAYVSAGSAFGHHLLKELCETTKCAISFDVRRLSFMIRIF